MKMKLSGLMLLMAVTCIGCATTVPTTMTKSWEKEVAFTGQNELAHTQIHLVDGGEAVTLVSPGGVETLDSEGGTVYKVDRQKLFKTYINTTRGSEEITDKITYLYLPHRHSLLEFNYSMTAESVTMIDLNSREISWMNEGLKWSLERYQVAARAAAKGLSILGEATADAASEVLLPERFVENMTTIVPQLDALLFKTLDGLKLISLETGEVLWNNEEIKGGIAKMFYDSESNSLVVVNSDDEAFKVGGLQFNKQIARIDAENGSTIWANSYDGNIREKLDGIGIWADRKADIRLLDDALMVNFLNVEMYDFKTGDKLWQTDEGANRLMDMAAPSSQIMNLFAFPVIHDEVLYRVGFENVGLTGVDIIVEAYDLYSGELVWKSNKLSRSKPVNNMKVADDKLIVTMGSSEGVVALDIANGNRVWKYEKFGRRGVQHSMYKTTNGMIAAGSDKIALLNLETGEAIYSIDTEKNGVGGLKDLLVTENGLAVSGSNGFALYNVSNGALDKKIVTPTGGMIRPGKNRFLMCPKPNYSSATYPVEGAFYVLDPREGRLLGTLGTDKNRRNLKIDDDFKWMYELTGSKIQMYKVQ